LRTMLLHIVLSIIVSLIASNAAHSQELLANPAPIKGTLAKPATRNPDTKKLLFLSGAVYTAALLDMHRTIVSRDEYRNQGFYEANPLARPLVQLPKPAYYATGLALATGINYLGWRMAKSRRLHKVWFLPQLLTIAGNSWGYSTS
jgi:hypothetical protein